MTINQTILLNVLTMIQLNPVNQDLSIYDTEDYVCDNCNGTGEKVKRGNHTSISTVRKCYACNNGMVTAVKLLEQKGYITLTDANTYKCTDKGITYLKSTGQHE